MCCSQHVFDLVTWLAALCIDDNGLKNLFPDTKGLFCVVQKAQYVTFHLFIFGGDLIRHLPIVDHNRANAN